MSNSFQPPVEWQKAQLPRLYERAKQILIECESVDECQRWAARAEAIASYYKQAKDETLVNLAHRIRLRAWRRIGELIGRADMTIDMAADLPMGGHAKLGGTLLGEGHGLSRKEITLARKLALADGFDNLVEAVNPPRLRSFTRSDYPRREKRGHDRLLPHIRGLAALFKKYPPDTFPRGVIPDQTLMVRDALTALLALR